MVFAVFFIIQFCGSRVQSDFDVFAPFVTSSFNSFFDQVDNSVCCRQVGCEAAFVTNSCGQTFVFQNFFQHVVDFCTHTQSFFEGRCANGHDHEFLYVNSVVSVFTTVHDVHHGNGHCFCIEAAQVLVQRHIQSFCCCFCNCHGNAQDCVCAQFCFVGCAVQFQHQVIDCNLIQSVHTDDFVSDDVVYVVNCILYACAVVSVTAVTQFYSFESTCGSTAGNSCTTDNAVVNNNFYFNCRIASGIQNLSCINICNFVIAFHVFNSSLKIPIGCFSYLLMSRLSPVISAGLGRPIISSSVGAMSANLPPSFSPMPSV